MTGVAATIIALLLAWLLTLIVDAARREWRELALEARERNRNQRVLIGDLSRRLERERATGAEERAAARTAWRQATEARRHATELRAQLDRAQHQLAIRGRR